MEENPYKAPMANGQKPTTASKTVKRPWCLGIGTLLGASLGGAVESVVSWAPNARPLEKAAIILGTILISGVTLGAIGLAIDLARWHLKSRA